MDLTKKYLGEGAMKKALEEVLDSVQSMKEIDRKLADVRRSFEAVDNSVGGTSMMKGINKAHKKAAMALNDFTWELKTAVKEYKTMLQEK